MNKITKRHFKMLFILLGGVFILALALILMRRSANFSFSFVGKPQAEEDGKLNVLLLGNAGGTHDGPYLTDSMMLLSYNLKTKVTTYLSLPRDIWIDKYKNKINAL